MDAFSFARAAGVGGPPQSDLQRAVTINILGKPYIPPRPSTETSPLLYHTNTFSSRWNCVLVLAARQAQDLDAIDVSDPAGGHPSVLPGPEPASPFPVTRNQLRLLPHALHRFRHSNIHSWIDASRPQASSRLSTFTSTPGGRSIKGLAPNRSAMFRHPGFAVSPLNSGRLSTSSVPISNGSHKFPTTDSAPSPPPPPHTPGFHLHPEERNQQKIYVAPFDAQMTPQTPAYPTFPPKSIIPRPPCPLPPSPPHRLKQTSAQLSRSTERGVQRAKYRIHLAHTSLVHLVNSRG